MSPPKCKNAYDTVKVRLRTPLFIFFFTLFLVNFIFLFNNFFLVQRD